VTDAAEASGGIAQTSIRYGF